VRRELVGRWLENYGSSLYEVDQVIEVFRASTIRGFLFVAARSTLEPKEAQELRRLVFANIEKRVRQWRGSVSGLRDFLSEPLLTSMLPMCELQPDLIAAVVGLLHSFISHDEGYMLERLWSGGHLAWLCRGMTIKSSAQLATVQSTPGAEASFSKFGKPWDRHVDLTATQSMLLRVIWALYQKYPDELCSKAVKSECLVKNWKEYLTYHCHFAWPLREQKEVEEATDTAVVLAMLLVAKLTHEVGQSERSQLLQQGILQLCFTVLLPTPQEQKSQRAAIGGADADADAALPLPDAKMIAGDIVSTLSRLVDTFKLLKARHFTAVPLAMFSQLHHWRKLIFEKQGSLSSLDTVSLLERCSSLYMCLLSSLSVEWCVENLGVYHMSAMGPIFLDMWSSHANKLLKQHSLRMFSSFSQVHVLYVHFLTSDSRSDILTQAVHRIFGTWDVRELRHVVWLLAASMAYALGLPVLPDHISRAVKKALEDNPECKELSKVTKSLGAELANKVAAKNLLLSRFLKQMISWCENPGDTYSRSWCLWIVTAVLKHGDATGAAAIRMAGEAMGAERSPEEQPAEDAQDAEAILVLPGLPNEEHLRRRARVAAEAAAVGVPEKPKPEGKAKVAETAYCKTAWLTVDAPRLAETLAKMATKCIGSGRKEFAILGCVAACSCFAELPDSPVYLAQFLEPLEIMRCVEARGDRAQNISSVLLLAITSSFRIPLKAQNLSESFLKRFFELQRCLLEDVSKSGTHHYELLAQWLAEQPQGLLMDFDFRCLVAFTIGQCIAPPLAAAPSLDVDTPAAGGAAQVLEVNSTQLSQSSLPAVAECPAPPALLLDVLAQEVLREDLRLQQAKGNGPHSRGPLFSTMLCNLLYALAVTVPTHPETAANSAAVRGAAFSQLIKVQTIVAQSVQPRQLFDAADGKREKLFLYVRATACIREALQCIMASWFAADFGVRFAISEEGGRDFIQYCTKHVNQVYNNKTALTKVLGTPWERLMLSQGPTTMIAELLLTICSSDVNLAEVSKLGGETALHSLSRYGESTQTRQQATMLLTKLAVMANK
jgi:hypothetical protein